MKDFNVGKEIGYVDGDYSDCTNRWVIKRIAKKLFPAGTDVRKLKVIYLCERRNEYNAWDPFRPYIYKVVSAEGICKFVELDYNDAEGGYYYEFKV